MGARTRSSHHASYGDCRSIIILPVFLLSPTLRENKSASIYSVFSFVGSVECVRLNGGNCLGEEEPTYANVNFRARTLDAKGNICHKYTRYTYR